MKLQTKYLFVVALLIFASCKNKPTETTNVHNVNGTVMTNGIPVSNAVVSLNKRGELTTTTDTIGHFIIPNVPEGDYSLTVEKSGGDGSFQSKTTNISVANDVYLQTLILPKGVKLLQPTKITPTSISLTWSSTDANDFREYKLYRHLTSGLDENSGTLVHVATSIADTVFKDENLNPLTKYYYRVYIMNDYGRLGGSNIVSETTLNVNLISDGGFEDSLAFTKNWAIYDTSGTTPQIQFDKSIKYAGNSSLHFYIPQKDTTFTGGRIMIQNLKYLPVVANTTYELSCMLKINGRRFGIDDGGIAIYQGTDLLKVLYLNGAPAGQNGNVTINWTKFSTTFIAPSNISIQVIITGSNESLWLDDLVIQPIK